MRSTQWPSLERSDGVAWLGRVSIDAGAAWLPSTSSEIGTPRALARRHTTATVGFAWLRSIWDSMDLETPARFDKASSDNPSAWRSLTKVSPTFGGASSKFLTVLTLIWLTTLFLCIIVEFSFDISN